MPAPDNYIGPEKVFGTSAVPDENDELLPIVNTITDCDNFVPSRHKKDDKKPTILDIPESLKMASAFFMSFIIYYIMLLIISKGAMSPYMERSLFLDILGNQFYYNYKYL